MQILIFSIILFPWLVFIYFEKPTLAISQFLFLGTSFVLTIFLTLYLGLNQNAISLNIFKLYGFFDFYLKYDALSGLLILTVSIIGFSIHQFSIRHLHDDPNQPKFKKYLFLTLTSVILMILSANLLWFIISTILSSLFLNKLLSYYSNNTTLKHAIHQKFWINRIGDIFLIGAGIIIYFVFGTLNYEEVFTLLKDESLANEKIIFIHLASLFIVFFVITQSALFPFHYWLPKTLDTPSPVSALIHAGIINSGGYLIIRLNPLLNESPFSLALLTIFATITVFFASLVMISQNNVKRSLVYSTIAQMGFMLIQCGLGAYATATVHIIGHAFYKSYAFLNSGATSDFGRLQRYFPKPIIHQDTHTSIFSTMLIILFTISAIKLFYGNIFNNPGITVLYLVLAFSMGHLFLNSVYKKISLFFIITISTSYLIFTKLMTKFLGNMIESPITHGNFLNDFALIFCIVIFSIIYLFQTNITTISNSKLGKFFYVKTLKGNF